MPTPIVTSAPRKHNYSDVVAMYRKRGAEKNKIMKEALDTIKNMVREENSPPQMDKFDTFGSYIASKLRLMNPEAQEYYEREILKVLIQPSF